MCIDHIFVKITPRKKGFEIPYGYDFEVQNYEGNRIGRIRGFHSDDNRSISEYEIRFDQSIYINDLSQDFHVGLVPMFDGKYENIKIWLRNCDNTVPGLPEAGLSLWMQNSNQTNLISFEKKELVLNSEFTISGDDQLSLQLPMLNDLHLQQTQNELDSFIDELTNFEAFEY